MTRTLTLELLGREGETVRTLKQPIPDSVGNITADLYALCEEPLRQLLSLGESNFDLSGHYQITMEVGR